MNRHWQEIYDKICEVFSILLGVCIVAFAYIYFAIELFDDFYGIDRFHHERMAKKHPVSRADIYSALDFVEPAGGCDWADAHSFMLENLPDSASLVYREILSEGNNYSTLKKLYHIVEDYIVPDSISKSLLNEKLAVASDKYEIVGAILDYYWYEQAYNGYLKVGCISRRLTRLISILKGGIWPQTVRRGMPGNCIARMLTYTQTYS